MQRLTRNAGRPPRLRSRRPESTEATVARFAWVVTLVLGLLNCRKENPLAIVEAGWLKASATGAIQFDVQGTGEFFLGRDPRAGIPVYFNLSSTHKDTVNDREYEVVLYRVGMGRPPTGRYRLGLLEQTDDGLRGFTAYVNTITTTRAEGFSSLSGVVEITKSSAGRVEGTFDFTAGQFCSLPGGPNGDHNAPAWCNLPYEPPPDAPTIQVTGAFVAVPAELPTVGQPG